MGPVVFRVGGLDVTPKSPHVFPHHSLGLGELRWHSRGRHLESGEDGDAGLSCDGTAAGVGDMNAPRITALNLVSLRLNGFDTSVRRRRPDDSALCVIKLKDWVVAFGV